MLNIYDDRFLLTNKRCLFPLFITIMCLMFEMSFALHYSRDTGIEIKEKINQLDWDIHR